MKKSKTQHSIYRVIDANLNRASEGLRVIEDVMRFLRNDSKGFLLVRTLRHKLDNITRKIYPEVIEHRNSVLDVGRKVKDEKLNSVSSILISNFKRVQESLRVLEEFSRLISQDAGYEFKNIRFKLYTLEKKCLEGVL
ncbi:MAG: thiamine-phosphate pyrophosphorylase [Elusimicrobiota bacterium]|nr:thiamine-phosphate pyrophosphorylase [Elusimicrobiota bacterium]